MCAYRIYLSCVTTFHFCTFGKSIKSIEYTLLYVFTQEACTVRRDKGDKLTIEDVMTILDHPGIVGNHDLANGIKAKLSEFGHQVSIAMYAQCDKLGILTW